MSNRARVHRRGAWVFLIVVSVAIAQDVPLVGQVTPPAEPTKAELIKTLEAFLPLLEANDYSAAAEFVMMPPRMKPEMLSGLLKANELSKSGIKQLAREAKFGKAIELFGAERAASFAKKMEADVEKCYGFNHETEHATAEIIAQWDGAKFKLVRIDDVGKLVDAEPEMKSDLEDSAPPVVKEDRDAILRKAAMVIQELETAVQQNPEDVASRAKLAMAFYQIGNLPSAWAQLIAAHQVDPNHAGVARGMDAMINAFTKQGVFTVGVPPETIQALLGDPSDKLKLEKRTRWRYGHWGIDFAEDGRVGEIIDLRGASVEWFQPTEKITSDLGGETWVVGFRRKDKSKGVVYFFVPGEMMSNYTKLVTVERLYDVAGTMESIGKKMIEDEEKLAPDSMHRVLDRGEDSMIIAAKIPGNPKSQTRHQLIRLWKGAKDLHRITYTIVSEDDPTRETQEKWLAIFKQATLDPVD